jgi:hypothetical protein
LNLRPEETLKWAEITALIPFSTPTGIYAQNRIVSEIAIFRQLPADFQFPNSTWRLLPAQGIFTSLFVRFSASVRLPV